MSAKLKKIDRQTSAELKENDHQMSAKIKKLIVKCLQS